MLKAYVGVASQHGLAVLQPERDDTLCLVERCVRTGGWRVGFWAVLGDAEADSVQSRLRALPKASGKRWQAEFLMSG